MRIAIIAPPWVPVPPPKYGGTEAVVDTLARGFQAAGHDVLLYATGDSTCAVPTAWVYPRAVGTIAIGTVTELRHVVNAYEAALEWEADVVHDNTLWGPLYADRFALPVVTTNHGPFESDLGDAYRAIAPSVPLIAISHHQASTARNTPIAATIHHGIDVQTFPFGKGEGGYLLQLGRMSPEKGIHTAARVAREAGMPLKIAAKLREPAEHDYFDAEVAPLLGGDIEYIGEVDGAQKRELLAGAVCLLNPVAWPEPFGLVMPEALAAGTPVVGTPCGSIPELIEDGVTGYVRDSEAGLVEALHQVARLDRARCRKDALARFSAERMAAQHAELYRRAIHMHRTRRAA